MIAEASDCITYFSSGGGGRAPSGPPSGERGGVFSVSIIANGASGGGSGLTEFVSIDFLKNCRNFSNVDGGLQSWSKAFSEFIYEIVKVLAKL